MSARRGAQLVPIGIPTICWKTFPEKPRKCSFRETQASCYVVFRVLAFRVWAILAITHKV